jgi:hypothetical protein
MGGAYSTNGEKRSEYMILVGKPEENRPLGIPRRRWEDNIMMDLREIRWCSMDKLIWFMIGINGGLFLTRQ